MSRSLAQIVRCVQFHASLGEAVDDVDMVLHTGKMYSSPTLLVLQANVTPLEYEES